MAYFNNAFRKTMLMREYVEVTAKNNTAELEVGELALFDARSFQGIDPAAGDCDPCPFMIVTGSPYANDRIGPFHGGYQETIKSKGINPKYVTKLWTSDSNAPQPYVLHVGSTEFTQGAVGDGCCPTFLCGEQYHLRVDVKGSPVLRMLNHQGYVEVTADGGCCPADSIAPVAVDPAGIMIQWAEGIWDSVVVTGNGPNFNPTNPLSADRTNPEPLIVPVVSLGPGAVTDTLLYPPGYFVGKGTLQADIAAATGHTVDTWDNYVADTLDPATDCAGLSLVGAYEDTRFGDCTFQTSDYYGLEPVRIFASEVDLNGDPCEFTGICVEVECEGRQAQGLGETAARDLILSESYRQNTFASDLRIREITQGNDLLDATRGGVDRTALYDRIMILHTVPRFNNPSGTFDNDQYLIEILTASDAAGAVARKAFLADLNQLFDNCNVPCPFEPENFKPCADPSVPVAENQITPAP